MRGSWLGALLVAAAGCGGGGATPPTPVPSPAEVPSSYAYLEDVSARGATVRQVSPSADAYRAEWSAASSAGVLGQVSEPQPTRYHALRLAPLEAGTTYSYRVRASSGLLVAQGTFDTPPAPGGRSIVFAATSDSGWVGGAEAQVAEAIRRSDPAPELLLHSGDVVYPHGERENYPSLFFEPFARVIDHVAFFPAIGNHDLETETGAPWQEVHSTPANNPERNPRYYSFDWGDVHFVVMDVAGTSFRPGSAQASFVSADLAASTAAWKVVSFHYPPFSCGPSRGNHEIQRYLLPLLEARRVAVVLGGHDHTYQRFKPVGGVLYVVSAGGGAPPDPIEATPALSAYRSAHHFLRGRADARMLQLEAVDLQGTVFDAVALSR